MGVMTSPPVPPSAEEISGWTAQERARVARILDAGVDRPIPHALRVRRRLVLAVTLGGAFSLFPWIGYLAVTLPLSAEAGGWRAAWVGYDVALACVLGTVGWLAWHRRQLVMILLPVAATLLITDAWFDLTLSWGTSEQGEAITAALVTELPVAALLIATEVSILRRAGAVLTELRGLRAPGPGRSALWQEPLLMAPADPEDPAPRG